jgi:hypothetical protein
MPPTDAFTGIGEEVRPDEDGGSQKDRDYEPAFSVIHVGAFLVVIVFLLGVFICVSLKFPGIILSKLESHTKDTGRCLSGIVVLIDVKGK